MFRICESERAENLREAVIFLQDEVYIRTCDLQDASKCFGADLYYHRSCLPSHINKYHRAKTNNIIKQQKEIHLFYILIFYKLYLMLGPLSL